VARGKWICTIAFALMLAISAGSKFIGMQIWNSHPSGQYWRICLSNGSFVIERTGDSGGWRFGSPEFELCFDWYFPYRWRPRYRLAGTGQLSGRDFVCEIPFWLPTTLLTLPMIILWRRDRRRPGVCTECGYDLTGNVSGKCPECGQVIGPGSGSNGKRTLGH